MLASSALLKLVLCAGQLKLAMVGFTQVGLSEAQASFYAEHFSVQLQAIDEKGVRVTTPKDMAAVLGVEKQKQLLGCADAESSCMAELAGALGADGLVTGQVAKIGKSYQLNVKIIAADASKTLFLHSSKLLPAEEDLIEELNRTAAQAIAKLQGDAGGAVTATVAGGDATSVTASSSAGSGRNKLKLLPGAFGIAAAGIGIVAAISANATYSKLANEMNWPTIGEGQAASWLKDGKQAAGVAIGLAVTAVVLIAGSLLWYLLT